MEWVDTSPPIDEHPITYKPSIISMSRPPPILQRYLSNQQSDHSAAFAEQGPHGFPEEPFDELKFQGYVPFE